MGWRVSNLPKHFFFFFDPSHPGVLCINEAHELASEGSTKEESVLKHNHLRIFDCVRER